MRLLLFALLAVASCGQQCEYYESTTCRDPAYDLGDPECIEIKSEVCRDLTYQS